MSWVTPQRSAIKVIQEVCELSDYTSPDGNPELLQCTATELKACIERTFEYFDTKPGTEQ
jgi:hypothetical protein